MPLKWRAALEPSAAARLFRCRNGRGLSVFVHRHHDEGSGGDFFQLVITRPLRPGFHRQRDGGAANAGDVVDVRTHYFLIYGLVRHERARRLKVSLVFRADVLGSGNTTRIIWVRDADAMPEQR